jgi:hypothetical protein
MEPEKAGKIKYGVWGIICGAIITMSVGFAYGGWSTAGATQKISEEAVLENQVSICVAQFMNQQNNGEKLKAFESETSWERKKFIEKGGWDKMPGQEKAGFAVARACASGLELLIEK